MIGNPRNSALTTEVEVRGSGGVKIAEVVEAVLGDADLPFRAARTALGRRTANGLLLSPLALGELRAVRGAEAVAPSTELSP